MKRYLSVTYETFAVDDKTLIVCLVLFCENWGCLGKIDPRSAYIHVFCMGELWIFKHFGARTVTTINRMTVLVRDIEYNDID